MEDKALVDEVRKYFSDRHLFLKNDWETEAIRYVKLNLGKLQKNSSHFDIAEAVFQQFLYSDLKDSLVPSLRIPKVAKKFNIVKPFIFQVVSVVDVSEPLFSQFRERKFADDDSIFQDPSEGSFELVTEVSKNTRVLKVELSDGEMILNGIVTENIEDLDTRTPPGTKILLLPRILSRNRYIRLKPNNCQILGGDCERLIQENWPTMKVLCQKLKINYEATSNKNKSKMMGMFKQIDKKQTVAKTEIEKIPKARPVKKATKRASLIKMECSTASKSETSVVGPMDKHVQRLPTQKPSVEDLAQLKKSSLIKMQGLTASKSETDVVGPMDKYVQPLPTEKPSIEDLAQLTVCEPVEDVLPLEHFKQQTSTLLDSVIVVPHDTRNESDFDLEDPKPTISTTDTLFDGGLLSILERKTKASKIDFTPPPVKKKEQFENPVIKKFLNLNVVKIGEMLTKKKYFLKPEVKIILPLMCKSDQEMTFKDDLWLYFIFVTDETATDVKMMVDPPLIDEFLGFSLSYALAVNSRGSLAQKEFCHKRAASFSGIFKTRLDLILHVEFSPDQDSVPVVKKVGYLAAALD